MKKLITRAMCMIYIAGMLLTLTLNFALQIVHVKKNFEELSGEYFFQIDNILDKNEKELKEMKEDFAKNCIMRAKGAAYMVKEDPSIIYDAMKCAMVASLLQVDELHFFNPKGVLYAGTNPEYYGLSMADGEQVSFFEPMLRDKSMELCQEITPNTAEKKMMQYAAVWSRDEKEIVQVGLEPERVLKAIEGNEISDIFAMISYEQNANFLAVDTITNEILGSTHAEYVGLLATEIGLDVTEASPALVSGYQKVDGEKQYCTMQKCDNVILIQIILPCELYRGMAWNMLLLFLYVTGLFLLLLIASYSFLDRRIISNIININKKLKQIENGEWHITLSDHSTEEFAQLCHYINSMVGSLTGFSRKLSKALEMSEVPIGICEYETQIQRFVATSRVKDILALSDEKYKQFMEHPEVILQPNTDYLQAEPMLGNHVYRVKTEGEQYIRIEVFDYQQSKVCVLIDITADIREKREIAQERDTDVLTGLYNRRAFFRMTDDLFMHNRKKRKDASLIMFDLDHLKKVNDQYGHMDGDKYIRAFADILHECKAQHKIAARLGGDEFVLLAYGLSGAKEMQQIIDSLLLQCDSKVIRTDNGEDIVLAFSMGWTFCPNDDTDWYSLLKEADKRMYDEKKRRKEKYHNA